MKTYADYYWWIVILLKRIKKFSLLYFMTLNAIKQKPEIIIRG